jgi:hypothetical protein
VEQEAMVKLASELAVAPVSVAGHVTRVVHIWVQVAERAAVRAAERTAVSVVGRVAVHAGLRAEPLAGPGAAVSSDGNRRTQMPMPARAGR